MTANRWREKREDDDVIKLDLQKALGLLFGVFVLMLLLDKFTRRDINAALLQTRMLIGILATIVGAGGTLRAFASDATNLGAATPGIVTILAGATLLEVGGWAGPAALGAAGTAGLVAYYLRRKDQPEPDPDPDPSE